MSEQCKEMVMKGFHSYQCSRKAVKDGYCRQHHPDAVKKQHEESEKRYQEWLENTPGARW